jgi:O-6-methylguanine DNA methyltransferase
MLRYLLFNTRIGWIVLAESPKGIALVSFLGQEKPSDRKIISKIVEQCPKSAPVQGDDSGLPGEVKRHILEYLENGKPLPEIPVDTEGGTAFERRVWAAISAIPFGETRSYKQVAREAGSPGAARATGGACGRNPVPIIVPCHRVIASSGKPGGFSAGPAIKTTLLELEKASVRTQSVPSRLRRQVSGL